MRIELRRKPLACQGNHSLLILNLLQVLIIGVTEYVIFPMQKMEVSIPKEKETSSGIISIVLPFSFCVDASPEEISQHGATLSNETMPTVPDVSQTHPLYAAYMCGNPEDRTA